MKHKHSYQNNRRGLPPPYGGVFSSPTPSSSSKPHQKISLKAQAFLGNANIPIDVYDHYINSLSHAELFALERQLRAVDVSRRGRRRSSVPKAVAKQRLTRGVLP